MFGHMLLILMIVFFVLGLWNEGLLGLLYIYLISQYCNCSDVTYQLTNLTNLLTIYQEQYIHIFRKTLYCPIHWLVIYMAVSIQSVFFKVILFT